jgi:hypothetical protein
MKPILIKFLLPIKSIIFLFSKADLYFPEFEKVLINPDKGFPINMIIFISLIMKAGTLESFLETLSRW